MGKAAARHIAACTLAGNQALPQSYPRRHFGFEFMNAFALFDGEAIHLIVGKTDIVFCFLWNRRNQRVDLFLL
jgi:hypothetical protein